MSISIQDLFECDPVERYCICKSLCLNCSMKIQHLKMVYSQTSKYVGNNIMMRIVINYLINKSNII